MSADEAALRSIDGALAELHQLLVLVEDWNDDSQPLLDSKLNAFVSRLGELRGCSFSEKLLVPPALLACVFTPPRAPPARLPCRLSLHAGSPHAGPPPPVQRHG
eukprot:PLAT6051.1.p2 GENE.PLAT6051.1~~PLAT6051.1.p2  ORF type:complete len:104 (-),score=36.71 PLAT6051.1:357-668(-)